MRFPPISRPGCLHQLPEHPRFLSLALLSVCYQDQMLLVPLEPFPCHGWETRQVKPRESSRRKWISIMPQVIAEPYPRLEEERNPLRRSMCLISQQTEELEGHDR